MIIAFRTDASLDIGTGHVMRCLTLADALRRRGAVSRFVCRAHAGNLIDSILKRGFEVIALPHDTRICAAPPYNVAPSFAYAHWLGADWEIDAEETRAALEGKPVDWLVVDHYALDARWERSLRTVCRRLMVIDDLADRQHDCDLLLDQNLGRSVTHYEELVSEGCTVLVSPRYALLRPEFAALRSYSVGRRANRQLKRLLISLGGVDKDNVTGKVLEALRSCPLPSHSDITVILGPHAPWIDAVRAQAASIPWPVVVLINARNMARLMAESDLAIGASGTTAWERCCLGLPTISLILAPNQRECAIALRDAGAVMLAHVGTGFAATLQKQIKEMTDSDTLTAFSSRSRQITDGAGATRLAGILTDATS